MQRLEPRHLITTMDAAIGRFTAQIERPGALKFASPIMLVPELFTTHTISRR